jgi:undecaprenyl-diphosphatase
MGVSPVPVRFRLLLALQVGTSFTNRLLPGGVGGAVLNERALERSGVDRATATGLVVAKTAEGALGHLALAGLAVAFAERGRFFQRPLPHDWPALVAVVGALVLAGLVLRTPFGRVHLVTPARRTGRSVADVVCRPTKALELVGGNVGVTLCYSGAMFVCLRAFDADLGAMTVAATYLAATAIASLAPTPGNAGAVEGALVAGFTAAGVTAEQSVAAVLTFRLVTFWLPILPGWFAFTRLRRRGAI